MATLKEVQARKGKPVDLDFLVDEWGEEVGDLLGRSYAKHCTDLVESAKRLVREAESPAPLSSELTLQRHLVDDHSSGRRAIEMVVQCWISARLENPDVSKPYDAWLSKCHERYLRMSENPNENARDVQYFGNNVGYISHMLPALKRGNAATLGCPA